MGAAPSVLTVPSSDLKADVEILKKIFSNQFRVEKEQDDLSLVLLGNDEKTVVFFLSCGEADGLAPASSRSMITTWTVNETQIQPFLEKDTGGLVRSFPIGDEHSVNAIHLRGGSTILLVPLGLASATSRESRKQLMAPIRAAMDSRTQKLS